MKITLHRSRLIAALLALALLGAACGSTNEDKSAAKADKTGDDPSGVITEGPGDDGGTATDLPGDAPAGSDTAAAPSGSTTRSGGTTRSGSGSTAASGSAPAAPGAPRVSPGITDKEILVGTIYANNGGAANAAFGYAGIGQIDFKRMWEAVIADINKTGIAGRKIKPIWYVVEGTDFSTTTDTHNQRACATWTEDNRVFLAFASGTVLNPCLAKKGVPQIVSTGGGDTQEFRTYPRLFSVAGMASDRVGRVVVDRLHDKGYYKGAKLGLVVYTQPTFERAAKIYVEELTERGVKVAQTANIKPRANTNGAGDEIAAIRSAVLKFKTEGITHVQFVSDNSAWVQLNFMKSAQDQQFFPKYGLNSNDGGMALATLLGPDGRQQLRNSVGVGWFPIFDVRAQDLPDSAPLARCKKIARDAGQDFSDPTRNTEAQAAGVCDAMFFFKEAMERGLPDLTNDSFRIGAEKVKGFAVANTFRSSMSATRHDGVGSVRLMEWFTDCECFKYTSPEQSV